MMISEGHSTSDEESPGPCCTICLLEYEVGDEICYSHNPSCTHCFHKVCILQWLKDHEECPCCRKNYLGLIDDDDENDEPATSGQRDRSSSTSQRQPVQQGGNLVGDLSDHTFARLYQTGIYARHEPSRDGVDDDSPRRRRERASDEPVNVRMERTLLRIQDQVRGRLEQIRRQQALRRRQQRNSDHVHDDTEFEPGSTDTPINDVLERSVRLFNNQLSSLREVVDRELDARTGDQVGAESRNRVGGDRWTGALQLVQTSMTRIQERIDSSNILSNDNSSTASGQRNSRGRSRRRQSA